MDLPLPLDIFLDIFSRLPIKSLILCKSVSKSWNYLTSHPLLPNLHLSRSSSSSSSSSLILYSKPSSTVLKTHLSILNHEDPSPQSPIKLTLPFHFWLNNFTVVGSCNGLLCLSEISSHSHDMYLYNPSTSDYHQIPNSDIDPTPFKSTMGFGFDTISEKYKVVRVLTDSNFFGTPTLIIQVHTVGSSKWSTYRELGGLYLIHSCSPAVYLNGVLHWNGYTLNDDNKYAVSVIYFDLGNEKLGAFTFPGSLNDCEKFEVSLMVMDGCLSVCYLVFQRLYGFRSIIWVMKDYGVKESWTKKFVLKDSPVLKSGIANAKPLCVNKNGEIIFICGGRQFIAYDPIGKLYRELGLLNMLDPVMAVFHCGSIIPVV